MITVVGNKPVMRRGDNEIGVVGDNLVKTLEFSIDRIQGAIDLNDYSAWALIERSAPNGGASYSTVVTKTATSDKITISLPITANETKDYGYIYASIRFAISNIISSFSNYDAEVAGTIKATSTAHGLDEGVNTGVIISGTTNYNGVYDVTWIDVDNFYFTDTWVSDQTGWWGVSPIWQTQRVLLKVAKGINGETEAEALEPSVFEQQVATLQAIIDGSVDLMSDELAQAIIEAEEATQDTIEATAAANAAVMDNQTDMFTTLAIENPYDSFTAKNLIPNPSFDADTTGWTAAGGATPNCTIASTGGKLVQTGTGASVSCQAFSNAGQIPASSISTGDKVYIGLKVKATTALCANVYFVINNAGTIVPTGAIKTNPVNGTQYTISGIYTMGTVSNSDNRIYLYSAYASTGNANGATVEWDDIIFVNLTTVFGAGSEPTITQWEKWLTDKNGSVTIGTTDEIIPIGETEAYKVWVKSNTSNTMELKTLAELNALSPVNADGSITPVKLSDYVVPANKNWYDKSTIDTDLVWWRGNSSWQTNAWLNANYSWSPAKVLATSAEIPAVNGDIIRMHNTSLSYGTITVHNAAGTQLAFLNPTSVITEYEITAATAAYILIMCDTVLASEDTLMVTINEELPSTYKPYGVYELSNLQIANVVGKDSNRWYGKTMAVLGDSITAATGSFHDSSTVWNAVVASNLGLTVLNYGIAGAAISIRDPASAFTPMITTFPTMSDDADLVIVFGGTNDWTAGAPAFGTITDADDTTFCGTINLLCDGLLTKYPSKTIAFITPIKRIYYTLNTLDTTNTLGKTLRDYCDAIVEICGRYGIPVYDANIKSLMNPFNAANSAANYGVEANQVTHPTVAGHIALANAITGFLKTL